MFDLPPVSLLSQAAPALQVPVAQRAEAALACAVASGTRVDKLIVADMSLNAHDKRLSVFDVSNPASPKLIASDWVAHGSGSDPHRTGMAQAFSDRNGSDMTSLGLYKIGERYHWHKGGWAYRLDGLTQGFNTHARVRGVVLHPAPYVTANGVGRSEGCAAVRPAFMAALEKQGLDNTLLWVDGGDRALANADVLNCPAGRELMGRRMKQESVAPDAYATTQVWNSAGAGMQRRVCEA